MLFYIQNSICNDSLGLLSAGACDGGHNDDDDHCDHHRYQNDPLGFCNNTFHSSKSLKSVKNVKAIVKYLVTISTFHVFYFCKHCMQQKSDIDVRLTPMSEITYPVLRLVLSRPRSCLPRSPRHTDRCTCCCWHRRIGLHSDRGSWGRDSLQYTERIISTYSWYSGVLWAPGWKVYILFNNIVPGFLFICS